MSQKTSRKKRNKQKLKAKRTAYFDNEIEKTTKDTVKEVEQPTANIEEQSVKDTPATEAAAAATEVVAEELAAEATAVEEAAEEPELSSDAESDAATDQNGAEPEATAGADGDDPENDDASEKGETNDDKNSSGSDEPEEIKKPSKSKKVKKALIAAGIAILSLAAVAAIAGFIIINTVAKPVVGELGEPVDLSYYETGFAERVCKVDPGNDLSTDKLEDRDISLTFFGFIHKKVTLSIKDTIPPLLQLRGVTTMTGMNIDAVDFVLSAEDRTELNFSFDGEAPDLSEEGEYEVTVVAEDEGGNRTSESAILTVDDLSLAHNIEFGETMEEIEKIVAEAHPEFKKTDLDSINPSECGDYKATAFDENETYYLFKVIISDTTPPSAAAHSFDVLIGSELTNDSLVSDIDDLSPTEVVFGAEPDLETPGTYTIPITVKDSFDNKLELESTVVVHKIAQNLTFERGISNADFIAAILDGDSGLFLPENFSALAVPLGTSELTLNGVYNTINASVTFKDTIKPLLILKELTAYKDQKIAPADFVSSCNDYSPITYAFESSISTAAVGDFPVGVRATDEAGNSVSAQTVLHVLIDETPPVIYGVKNLTVILGQALPSFTASVYATDDVDGNVTVNVDSSAVNAAVAGTYTIKYSATDRAGNYAEATADVVVSDNRWDILNSTADAVLAQIVTPGMSARDKAWAIYSWCTANIRYSTSTSYLMGNYVEGALSGFKIRSGNCYIYYAVSDILLERAGITSMEIHRNIPGRPHYWNLVLIGGCWYHFDTCPHYRAYPLQAFLLTDAQVANYSAMCTDYYSFDTWAYPRTP